MNIASSVSRPPNENLSKPERKNIMSIILVIILIVVLISIIPAWPYSRGWGYYPSGGIGLILIILLLLWLFGAF
jgi:polyferredoxin